MPYQGLEVEEPQVIPQIRPTYAQGASDKFSNNGSNDHQAFWSDSRTQDRIIELVVKALVNRGVNITESYDEWTKVGWALKAHPYGERLFHELSACSQKYNSAQTAQKWRQLGRSNTVSYNYLIHACKQNLGDGEYHSIKQQVWRELR